MATTVDGAERAMIRQAARGFALDVAAPLAEALDREERFPREAWDHGADLGFLGVTAPEQLGGAGLGMTEMCIVAEELAAVCMATSVTLAGHATLGVECLVRNASSEQRERLLPGLCDGSVVSCTAITEPEAGSDALGMRTRAVRTEGGWLLSGSKTFITNAPVADLALVYAKTGAPDGRELGLFAVPVDTPGLVRGPRIEKMGWRGSPTGDLSFDEVFVSDENLIGEPAAGTGILLSGLNNERALLAAMSIGLARGALDAAIAYARERRQFGRRIGDFQLIRAKLADMYAGIEACRALTYEAAAAIDAGRDEHEVRRISAAAKLLAADVVVSVTSEAVQIFGGYGYTKEYPVERFMRDAKVLQIGGGTAEIQRNLIGKALVA